MYTSTFRSLATLTQDKRLRRYRPSRREAPESNPRPRRAQPNVAIKRTGHRLPSNVAISSLQVVISGNGTGPHDRVNSRPAGHLRRSREKDRLPSRSGLIVVQRLTVRLICGRLKFPVGLEAGEKDGLLMDYPASSTRISRL